MSTATHSLIPFVVNAALEMPSSTDRDQIPEEVRVRQYKTNRIGYSAHRLAGAAMGIQVARVSSQLILLPRPLPADENKDSTDPRRDGAGRRVGARAQDQR